MQIVTTLLVIVLFAFTGLAIWASAERPLALREIAINTRRDRSAGPDYPSLRVLSVLLRVLAVVLWNVGLLLVLYLNLSDSISFL